MKVKHNVIISFGECGIEIEKGDKYDVQGNAVVSVDVLSPHKLFLLSELLGQEFHWVFLMMHKYQSERRDGIKRKIKQGQMLHKSRGEKHECKGCISQG